MFLFQGDFAIQAPDGPCQELEGKQGEDVAAAFTREVAKQSLSCHLRLVYFGLLGRLQNC